MPRPPSILLDRFQQKRSSPCWPRHGCRFLPVRTLWSSPEVRPLHQKYEKSSKSSYSLQAVLASGCPVQPWCISRHLFDWRDLFQLDRLQPSKKPPFGESPETTPATCFGRHIQSKKAKKWQKQLISSKFGVETFWKASTKVTQLCAMTQAKSSTHGVIRPP